MTGEVAAQEGFIAFELPAGLGGLAGVQLGQFVDKPELGAVRQA